MTTRPMTPRQLMLLRATFGCREVALRSWGEWSGCESLDAVDPDSHVVLPLLHRRLTSLGVQHSDVLRLRGVQRFWWTRNQLRLRQLDTCLTTLERADVETMVVGAAAVAVGAYSDISLRPLDRVEVMVRTEDVDRALAALVASGLRSSGPGIPRDGRGRTLTNLWNGTELLDPGGNPVGLRWHLLPECLWHGADETFWQHAQDTLRGGLRWRTPCPTDLLLAICCARPGLSPLTPERIVDATVLLERQDWAIDWGRLESMVRRRLLVLPVKQVLEAVESVTGAQLPAPARRFVDGLRVSWLESRSRAQAALGARDEPTLTGLGVAYWRRHEGLTAIAKLARVPALVRKRLAVVWRAARQEVRG